MQESDKPRTFAPDVWEQSNTYRFTYGRAIESGFSEIEAHIFAYGYVAGFINRYQVPDEALTTEEVPNQNSHEDARLQ